MDIVTKSAYLTVRVSDETRTLFCIKARKFGTSSAVLRELVDAFLDDRITIKPPAIHNPNPLEKLYEH